MEDQIPVIYFLGTSPGRYQPIIPTFIVGWHPEHLRVQLAFGVIVGASAQATLPASPERRYALREIKARFASGIVSRCRPERLRRSLCDLASARAATARCRPYRHGCRRAARAADRIERVAVDENPPCGLRCPSDRRPRQHPLRASCSGSSNVSVVGAGPFNTDTVPRRSSELPSTSASGRKKPISLDSNLMRRAVVDPQGIQPATNVDAERPGGRVQRHREGIGLPRR
jgi:hypothetical protein